MIRGLHGCPEEQDVDLIDGKIQETAPGVRDIRTETRPHDAVPSWPVSSIKLLSAKDEVLSVRTVVQHCSHIYVVASFHYLKKELSYMGMNCARWS